MSQSQESKPHTAPEPSARAGESWAGFLIEAVVDGLEPEQTPTEPNPVRPTARTRILTTRKRSPTQTD
ncbi:MAG: hypothetical protein ACPG77_17075 [Nannocystaceae bacterium]